MNCPYCRRRNPSRLRRRNRNPWRRNPRGKKELFRLLGKHGRLLRDKNHLVYALPDNSRFVLSKSPSDSRAYKNALSDLKKILKKQGIRRRNPWQTWARSHQRRRRRRHYRHNPTVSCPSCGVGVRAAKSICWKCGSDVREQSASDMFFGAKSTARSKTGYISRYGRRYR